MNGGGQAIHGIPVHTIHPEAAEFAGIPQQGLVAAAAQQLQPQ